MSRAVGRLGWGEQDTNTGILPSELPALQPQWIPAGAFTPLSGNTNTTFNQEEFTVADDIRITTIEFLFGTTDKWFVVTKPPVNWTSAQIKFIADYIVTAAIAPAAGTVVWTLGADVFDANSDPDAVSFDEVTITDTLPDTTIPKYRITAESAALTVTGGTDSDSLILQIRRAAGTESDEVNLVGLKILYV